MVHKQASLPVAPAKVLPDQADGHGCLIWIQFGHVEVINKVNELLCARRAIVDASLLLQW